MVAFYKQLVEQIAEQEESDSKALVITCVLSGSACIAEEKAKAQRRSLIVTPETALKAVCLSVCKKIMWKQAVLTDLSCSSEEYWDRHQMFSLDLMHLPIGGI